MSSGSPTHTRSTIAQVAREVGVSKSTVSHAFSGRRYVSESVKARVFAAARRLNYRPYYAAQVLAHRRTRTIGVVIRELAGDFTLRQLEAVARAADARGYRVTLGFAGNHDRKVREHLESFASGQADGVLVLTAAVSDELIREFAERGCVLATPMRVIEGAEDLCPVRVEIAEAFGSLLEHLYQLGHRRFGFVCGQVREVRDRYDRLRRFVDEKGLELDDHCVVTGLDSVEEGDAAAGRLLERQSGITALVCSNDNLAVGVLTAARRMGLAVPDDLTVTGCDDVPIGRYCTPRLTTIRLPIAQISEAAVNHLIDRIEGADRPIIVRIRPELLIRESSAPPPSPAKVLISGEQ
ncbi:MAG: LacI family transcriptional regulator [Phycisphaerae bacterium]|nr:LacI family transcriptional regulator [Phycisphaerae bacterium]